MRLSRTRFAFSIAYAAARFPCRQSNSCISLAGLSRISGIYLSCVPLSGLRLLVQVCEALADPAARAREVGTLAEAMAEPGLRQFLVTRHEQEEIEIGSGATERRRDFLLPA